MKWEASEGEKEFCVRVQKQGGITKNLTFNLKEGKSLAPNLSRGFITWRLKRLFVFNFMPT